MSSEHSKLGQQLHQTADEIRVKMHLAGMDAKDAWEKLEPRLHEYERKAATATDNIADELTQLGRGLKKELSKLLEELTKS